MQDEMRYAVSLHQAGQLGQAALLYQRILSAKPEHAEALHLLGVLHHQQGEHARAVAEIGRAVALRPSVPLYHANLKDGPHLATVDGAALRTRSRRCRSAPGTRGCLPPGRR